ncbi:MAG: ABC transporter ATP-binding protein [Firmicutes bacterium]|nr:ABC transporter ATP-binding protein [Bacillota bacterium]
MLSIRNATFAYSNKPVFEDICLEVEKGGFYCILGPNGSGKTTLLKCLAGILPLAKGKVYLNDTDLSRLHRNTIAKLIGYVMQEQETVFPFTVRQMVAVGRAPYIGLYSSPSAEDLAIVEEVIAEIGLTELRDKKYLELSGGEKQLVMIARVLAQKPQVLLMDEPASHLDFKNQERVMQLIKKLSLSGITVIMSTHFPNHAFAYADRVAIIHEGKILADGPTKTVMTEENLSLAYDMPINILTVKDRDNQDHHFCVAAQKAVV